jgi:hypothetical protein
MRYYRIASNLFIVLPNISKVSVHIFRDANSNMLHFNPFCLFHERTSCKMFQNAKFHLYLGWI